jgi:translation initiation factor 1
MSKKNEPDRRVVYSTDPNFKFEKEPTIAQITPAPALQSLRLSLDKRHRAGKAVTVLEGFLGTKEDLEILGKKLKTHCGTGGSVKEGQILIQGDQRQKLLAWLISQGYVLAKSR